MKKMGFEKLNLTKRVFVVGNEIETFSDVVIKTENCKEINNTEMGIKGKNI